MLSLAFLRKHQMASNAGTVRGPWAPWNGRFWWLQWRIWQWHLGPRSHSGWGCRARGGKAKDLKIKLLEISLLPAHQGIWVNWHFLSATLKNEVLKRCLCKSRSAGQSTWFKAFVTIGNYNGHIGLGVKHSKEVATTICGAIILANFSIVPVWRGYYGNTDKPHTVRCRVIHCGSVLVCLIPAPRGTGIVSAHVLDAAAAGQY